MMYQPTSDMTARRIITPFTVGDAPEMSDQVDRSTLTHASLGP